MGRPTKYNKKIAEKICSLIATDTYTVAEVCRMVKISDSTYYDWITRFPEFSENIKKAEAERMAFFVAEAKKKPSTKDTRVHGTGKTHHYGRFRQVRHKRQGDTANKGTKDSR